MFKKATKTTAKKKRNHNITMSLSSHLDVIVQFQLADNKTEKVEKRAKKNTQREKLSS